MTAIAIAPRWRLRPRMLLASSLVVVIASQLAVTFSQPVAPPQAPVVPQPAAVQPESPGGPANATAADLAQIDRSLRVWTANLIANDRDFYSATTVGLLYDARGRLTGDVGDYGRSLEALNRAVAIEPAYLPARLLHARGLLSTHDFAAALSEAQAIDRDSPGQPQAIATIGDAALELGDLELAQAAYDQLATLAPGAPVSARQARVALLTGDNSGAAALAAAAEMKAELAADSGPSRSWYAYLSGAIALANGRPNDALASFDRAVALWPDSYLALAGRARALAAADRHDEAIDSYEAAIAISPQPESLAALGDLYKLAGNDAAAQAQYDTVEFIGSLAAINEQVYNRSLVLFWLNHDREPQQALAMAEAELATRTDIYSWDAYAWALLANDRPGEADVAMASALALGTRDAVLLYHAGVIALAMDDTGRARTLLAGALDIDGALDPLAEARARSALEALP